MKLKERFKCFEHTHFIFTVVIACLIMGLRAGPGQAYDDRWTTLAAPYRDGWTLNLKGVWGTSERNVYTAGFFFDDAKVEPYIPVVYHYDGYDVEEMTIPDTYGIFLGDIWGSSNSNIYAVGQVHPTYDTWTAPYMLHYDGNSWSEVTNLPNIGDLALFCVWGTSANDIFVGSEGEILHYDGATWTTMTLPAFPQTPEISEIWGASPTDVWAVGFYYDEFADPQYTGIILHYDGATWTMPYQGDDLVLYGAWGTSSSNVFFCGSSPRSNYEDIPRIIHYDGSSAYYMTVPDVVADDYGNIRGQLWDIWGASGDDLFTTGAWVVYRYDGSSWSQQLNSSGLSGWAYNNIHNFKGGWDFSKYGNNVQSTSGVKIKVATSEGDFDFISPIDPNTIVDDRNRPSDLPYGLFDYSIPVPAYDLVRITFQFPGKLDDSLKWFKYDPDTGWYQYNRAYFSTVIEERDGEQTEHTIVRIYIEDNGDGDSDPRPGYINDPSGPGNEGGGGGVGGGGGGGGGCFLNTNI